MTQKLDELRQEVDQVNLELLRLLNRRASLAKMISEYKDGLGLNYFDPEREREMFEALYRHNEGPLPNYLVSEIFNAIFSFSLKFMGITREQKLLVSSKHDHGFLKIQEIFNLAPGEIAIVAGPCAVEKIEYLETVGFLLKEYGIKFLRAGAFKPRTSPYEFQGLKEEGLKMLKEVGKKFGLFTVTEVVDTRYVEMVAEYVDVIQVGARNMQNFELLKEVGQSNRPVLLKRGLNATIHELMLSAEYIGLQGNRKLILCERGIRTYETKTRNTLDISCVPIIKKETNLPILIDLSHSLGRKDIVNPVAKAALAVGADGIMVEVHPFPELALSDSKQQLNPKEFEELLGAINWVKA